MGLEGGIYVLRSGIEQGRADRIGQGYTMLDENIERIAAFVHEFLSFARGSTPRVAAVDPAAVARKVIELFRDKAAMVGLELIERLQADLAPANLDEEGIHTCLANLVSNALDACQMSDERGRRVTVSVFERKGSILYEVADDGCGMDYEIKKKVFTTFFSTKGSDKGTGLGLLTTRKIVQEHGGRIDFESALGEGSVFRIELPRERLPQPAPPTTDVEERHGQSRG
jgi:signal transduction histidine kinase